MSNWLPVKLLFGFMIRDAKELQGLQEADVSAIHSQRVFINIMQVEALSTFKEMQAKCIEHSKPYCSSFMYQLGDLVLCHQMHLKLTYSTQAKMAPRWTGPYAIVSKQQKMYIIQRLVDSHEEWVHQDQLKPYWLISDSNVPGPDDQEPKFQE
ncbi:uncharacterized protein SPSC_01822 [Sporisorium scitamineum]|uniref:Uncharacterized protein n=1 Tax=Sporisorium scitamineum TaxID=49012 RepID=A0A127ZCK1_9BASI|nr:uncharacterized protein SPSC_01822 [Sporisorium scitamineum]